MYLKIFTLLFSTLVWVSPVHATINSVFAYTDKNGNKVYSDKRPSINEFVELEIEPIETVAWISSELKIKTISTKPLKRKQPESKTAFNKKEYCFKAKLELEKTKTALATRQKPEKFDQLKSKLSELRWQYRQKCI